MINKVDNYSLKLQREFSRKNAKIKIIVAEGKHDSKA